MEEHTRTDTPAEDLERRDTPELERRDTPAIAERDTPAGDELDQGETPAPSEVDVAALARKVEQLEAQNRELEARNVGQAPAGSGPTTADVDELREQFADWPQKGGSDLPQPWDYQGLGINPADVGPGEPDRLSPVSFDHGKPTLTAGAGGPGPEGDAVAELCERLAVLGYPTSWSTGENPFNLFDPDVERAVSQFRNDYGIEEDPSPFGGNHEPGRRAAGAHCGPVTWAGLIRASDRERQEA